MRKLLFQGDSITESDRLWGIGRNGLGDGYVSMIADYFEQRGEHVMVINKGISGNKTRDLLNRWQEDCIEIQPDVLTILTGINDVWEKMDSQILFDLKSIKQEYERMLSLTREKTNADIIIMEPFVLPYPADRIRWREYLDPMIHMLRKLAKQYRTRYIPLDGILAKEAIETEYDKIAEDGVHLTKRGHLLLMVEWLKAYESLVKEV